MNSYSLTHLSDPALLCNLKRHIGEERGATAVVLAHLAEVDDRRLYLPAAHPSMFSYCVGELGYSEDAAYKRIQAARIARKVPVIFERVADGRLHLSGLVLLAPHLTPENAAELLGAATGKTKSQIEEWLAQRFPRSEVLPMVAEVPPASEGQLAPGQVGDRAGRLAQEPVEAVASRSKVAPVAPERYAVQFMMDQQMRDDLGYAQALLGHRVSSGDLGGVFGRALKSLICELEKRKFAATLRPRRQPRRASSNPRHVPAAVRRQVWQRDQGQCTFVSDAGHRCTARSSIEFDHVDPVARGGRATVDGIRLRCRAHNQYQAECTFGAGFMEEKRDAARAAAGYRRAAGTKSVHEPSEETAKHAAAEVIPYLRELGMRAQDARTAAAQCESIPDASLEERVRLALKYHGRQRLGRPAGVWAPA